MDAFAPAHELAAALRAGETTAAGPGRGGARAHRPRRPCSTPTGPRAARPPGPRPARRSAASTTATPRRCSASRSRSRTTSPRRARSRPSGPRPTAARRPRAPCSSSACARPAPSSSGAPTCRSSRSTRSRSRSPGARRRNPWDLGRSPGGSSGGSAAAVAAGTVPVAHATDGGGSIRFPASCCHLFGLKPQRGRVSLMPDADHWNGLSTANCVARSVLDSAHFLDVIAGPEPGDADVAEPPAEPYADVVRRADPGRLRIAVSVKPHQPGRVHPDVVAGVRETAEALRALGHQVDEADPPQIVQLPAFYPRYARSFVADADAHAASRAPRARHQAAARARAARSPPRRSGGPAGRATSIAREGRAVLRDLRRARHAGRAPSSAPGRHARRPRRRSGAARERLDDHLHGALEYRGPARRIGPRGAQSATASRARRSSSGAPTTRRPSTRWRRNSRCKGPGRASRRPIQP